MHMIISPVKVKTQYAASGDVIIIKLFCRAMGRRQRRTLGKHGISEVSPLGHSKKPTHLPSQR